MNAEENYRACHTRSCLRKVAGSADYCCLACKVTRDGHYEIDEHGDWCDARMQQRGQYTPEERTARIRTYPSL